MQNLYIYKASAGSGKTHILTLEYLKLAFQHPEKFKTVLAVTFTNKAAEEMKERILSELNKIAINDKDITLGVEIKKQFGFSDDEMQQNALKIRDNLLHNYSDFSISTIDSFVQKVIRSFSYEIQAPSGYKIELDDQKVISELTDALYKDIGNNPDLLNWLTTFAKHKVDEGKNWDFRDEIRNLAKEIFKEQFQVLSESLFDNENNENQLVEQRSRLRNLYSEIININLGFKEKMSEISRKAKKILESQAIDIEAYGRNFKTICNYLCTKISGINSNFDYEPGATVLEAVSENEKWYAKTAKNEIKNVVISLIPLLQPLLNEAVANFNTNYKIYITSQNVLTNFYAFGILDDIAKLLPDYRQQNNLLLISDTTLLLKKIISGNDTPFIYEKIGNRFQHVLIDEFQDTSGFQWTNFKPLIENSLANANFNLIVGDIKQSIYRWRGGDWTLLLTKVQQQVGEIYILEKSLDTNWRSSKNIIDFNNTLFYYAPLILQNHFNASLSEIDNSSVNTTNYTEILTKAYSDSYQLLPDSKTKTGGRVKINFIPTEPRSKVKKWREQIPLILPETIDNLLKNKNYEPRDITILVRKNSEGKEIVDMLLDYQNNTVGASSYQIISAESLFIINSSAIRLLISCLRYIHNPSDHINLTTLILEYYKTNNNRETEWHSVFCNWRKQDFELLLPNEFIINFASLRQFSLYELVEKLISIFDLDLKIEEFPYLRTFQDAVLRFTQDYYSDLDSFLKWWDEKSKSLSIQLSDKQNAVKIMTIHKSKGLAFKIVIIPFCDWNLDHSSFLTAPIVWCNSDKYPFNLYPYLPVRYKKELGQTYFIKDYFDEKMYAYMDAINMLYVAFTRPKEELIVFAPADDSESVSVVGDLLYKSVKLANNPLEKDSKKYIALTTDFCEESMVYENKTGYAEIGGDKYKKEFTVNNEFPMDYYPNYDWREKLSIVHNSKDFFIESVQHIEDKVNYGTLMHEIFSRIITIEDIDNALTEILYTGRISTNQKTELKKKLVEIINRPEVINWFSSEWIVLTEKALLTKKGEIRIPDRVLIGKEKNIVIDFKFGEIHPEHKDQVNEYVNLLTDLGYKNTEGIIYYADKNKMITIAQK